MLAILVSPETSAHMKREAFLILLIPSRVKSFVDVVFSLSSK